MLIREFDPWESSMCTCPKKYSFNPYTGCEHCCIYCYITSYIPNGFSCRIKENLLRDVKRERKKLNPRIPISMSNSSDPYTPMENKYKLTRACLEILKDFKLLIITKSDLVTRDIDLLKNMRASVSMTITTLEEELARRLEPFAPAPERRLRTLEKLIENDVPVSCRIDPVIPYVNDDANALVKELSDIGVPHVVSSTFKPRHDSWRRFEGVFNKEAGRLEELYFERGSRCSNSFYLPKEVRFELMESVRKLCTEQRITFASCREGFKNKVTCDGSHLIKLAPAAR